MVAITLLLIVILLLVLRFTLKKFMTKPCSSSEPGAGRRQAGRARQTRIVHTQLDLDTPYAQVDAPPSYRDTLRADRRTQLQDPDETRVPVTTEDEDSHLILGDALSNTDSNV